MRAGFPGRSARGRGSAFAVVRMDVFLPQLRRDSLRQRVACPAVARRRMRKKGCPPSPRSGFGAAPRHSSRAIMRERRRVAEGEGFEPPVRFPVQRFSRPCRPPPISVFCASSLVRVGCESVSLGGAEDSAGDSSRGSLWVSRWSARLVQSPDADRNHLGVLPLCNAICGSLCQCRSILSSNPAAHQRQPPGSLIPAEVHHGREVRYATAQSVSKQTV